MRLKKNHVALIILLLIISVLVGCVEKEPKDEITPQSKPEIKKDLRAYFPAVPNMFYAYEGEGNEYAAFIREVSYVDKPFVQIQDNNGGTIMAQVYKVEADKISRVFQQGEAYEEKNLIPEVKSATDTKEEVLLKLPIEEGTSWESDEWKREIVGITETVTVPAGTFYEVIKVELTPKNQENPAKQYEYYAENIGLVLREYKGEDFAVISRLKSYEMKSAEAPSDNKQSAVNLNNPNIPLLAYQLERELRSSFQTAYESYINLENLAAYNSQHFAQILTLYRLHLQEVAVQSIAEEQVQRLQEYYNARAGEVTFPTHEVVKQAKVLANTLDKAKVSLTVHKFYPAREWSGKAYDRVVDYVVELVKVGGQWKIERVGAIE